MFTDRPLRKILFMGAHPDDIELGCGGLIQKLIAGNADPPHIHWVVFSGTPDRHREARRSAETYLAEVPHQLELLDFPDGYFPAEWSAIKSWFQQLAVQFDPDLILTHRLDDRHQDHQTLGQLTWNAFRHHEILEYEIPKYEGDLGENNFYCSLSKTQVDNKIRWLTECFASQRDKPWFDPELFRGLMRIRGSESPARPRFAEAFLCRKFAF